jgi:hypothetical protein
MTFLNELIKNEESVKRFSDEYYANIGKKEVNICTEAREEIPFAMRFGGYINEKTKI